MQVRFLVIGLVLAALVIGLWAWLRNPAASDPVSAPIEVVPEPAAAPGPKITKPMSALDEESIEPPAGPPLPALGDSDAQVRDELIAANPQTPEFSAWFERDDLVRRFVVVLENASRGEYPKRQLGFLAPAGAFLVLEEDERLWVDAEGYARYTPFVHAVTSIEPRQAADLWTRFMPLVVEALAELGIDGQTPDALLLDAIELALATPAPVEPIELTQPSVLYEFADPELESLPPLSKQLLRMGPENLARLQAYLREVRAALE